MTANADSARRALVVKSADSPLYTRLRRIHSAREPFAVNRWSRRVVRDPRHYPMRRVDSDGFMVQSMRARTAPPSGGRLARVCDA